MVKSQQALFKKCWKSPNLQRCLRVSQPQSVCPAAFTNEIIQIVLADLINIKLWHMMCCHVGSNFKCRAWMTNCSLQKTMRCDYLVSALLSDPLCLLKWVSSTILFKMNNLLRVWKPQKCLFKCFYCLSYLGSCQRSAIPTSEDLWSSDIFKMTPLGTISWWRHQLETFSALLALFRGIQWSPVNSPHKGQWRGALMFSWICALNKQSSGWWCETPSRSLWRHWNVNW